MKQTSDAVRVERFLLLDEWEARRRMGPYERTATKPARRPSRIIWFLAGAASALTVIAIVI